MAGKPVFRGTRSPVGWLVAQLAHTPDLEDPFRAHSERPLAAPAAGPVRC
jgi:hypothetical protein